MITDGSQTAREQTMAEELAVDIDLAVHKVQEHSGYLLPYAFARRHHCLLCPDEDQGYRLCYREPLNLSAVQEIRRYVGQTLQLQPMDPKSFEQQLAETYQHAQDTRQRMSDIGDEASLQALAEELPEDEDLLEADDGAPIIRLINAILSEAVKEGASDIHIETFEKNLTVRFRVDGVLREILHPQRKLAALLVSRIKVMAKLDIAEKRIPQDGRISLRIGGRGVDVRVSTLPSRHGERIVLRLLDRSNVRLNLAHLGMPPALTVQFRELLQSPHGILLVTGPTGSGKSTTLYAGVSEINNAERNILTVEDPIEYDLEGVGQTQVNPKVDMTFASGLRAILRQDPDVVMIGEIRDLETADIAIQASLTGHLVLSTLHTNTAVGAVTRLRDMGVEPFLLASSLVAVLAQRLVRTLCRQCRQPRPASVLEQQVMALAAGATLWECPGCEACHLSGYRGRTGIHELFLVDDTVRQMIHEGAGEQAIERVIRQTTASIQSDGFAKVLAGITTLEEVMRVTKG